MFPKATFSLVVDDERRFDRSHSLPIDITHNNAIKSTAFLTHYGCD